MGRLRRNAVFKGAVLGTATLVTIAVLAITGSVLSRVHEIDGKRGGTLTVVSLEGSPDLDPARINDVYGTMISRAVDRTPYTFRPDREGVQPDLAEGPPDDFGQQPAGDDHDPLRRPFLAPSEPRSDRARRGLWHRPRVPSQRRLAVRPLVLW